MATTEHARHQLHQRLDTVLGTEEASTLMEHLHPSGWEQLATKDDLARLDDRLTAKIESLDHRLTAKIESLDHRLTAKIESLDHRLTAKIDVVDASLRGALHREMRINTLVTIGVLGTLTTVVSAIT